MIAEISGGLDAGRAFGDAVSGEALEFVVLLLLVVLDDLHDFLQAALDGIDQAGVLICIILNLLDGGFKFVEVTGNRFRLPH